MFSIRRLLASLALLCTWSVFILAQDSAIRTFSNKLTLEMKNVSSTHYDENMESKLNNQKYRDYLLYSECSDQKLDSNFKSCNVTARSWPLPRISVLAVCKNYKISAPTQDIWQINCLSKNMILFVVGPRYHHLVVKPHHDYEFNINILNMENCSNVANIPFTLKVEDEYYVFWFLTQFDETFEIVDKNKTHCKGVSSCKRIYDFNGNEIGDPKPFKIQNNATYYPVSRESSDKGYYALLRKVAQSRKLEIQLIYEVQRVDASGNSRKLLTMPQEYDFRVFTFPDDMAVDVRNELCTICGRHFNDSRDLCCLQFDTQGMKLNVTMEMPTYGKKLAIYNLTGGGILVVFGFCYKVDNIVITSWLEIVKCSEFQIQRIGANGHMFSPLIIDGFDETDFSKLSRFHMHITENDHTDFCLTSVGPMQPSNTSTSVYEAFYYK